MYALSAALLDAALDCCDFPGAVVCCLTSSVGWPRTWTMVASAAFCGESAMMVVVGEGSQETERQQQQGKQTCI